MFFSGSFSKYGFKTMRCGQTRCRRLFVVLACLLLFGCKDQVNQIEVHEISGTSVISRSVSGAPAALNPEDISESSAAKVKHTQLPVGNSDQSFATDTNSLYASPSEIVGLIRSFVPNGEILNIDTSEDGRVLVFESSASNLVRGDTNQTTDVFLLLVEHRILKRISVDSHGNQVVGNSVNPRISPDGGWVVYESSAKGLDTRDLNQFKDVYLYEVGTGITRLVSLSLTDTAGNRDSRSPVVSRNANVIAFESEATNLIEGDENKSSDVFVYNRLFDSVSLVSVPIRESGEEALQRNMASYKPDLSDDGVYVTFESFSPYLALDDYNSNADVFLHNIVDQSTTLISKFGPRGAVVTGDSTRPSISADGKSIVFQSQAQILKTDTNEVHDAYIYDVLKNKLSILPAEELYADDAVGFAGSYQPVISGDGSTVVYEVNLSAKSNKDTQQNYGSHLAYYDTSDSTFGRLKLFDTDDKAINNIQGYSVSLSSDAEVLAFHVSLIDDSQSGRTAPKTGWLTKKHDQNGSSKESVGM